MDRGLLFFSFGKNMLFSFWLEKRTGFLAS